MTRVREPEIAVGSGHDAIWAGARHGVLDDAGRLGGCRHHGDQGRKQDKAGQDSDLPPHAQKVPALASQRQGFEFVECLQSANRQGEVFSMRKKSWMEVPTNGPAHVQPRPMLDRLAERIAKVARPDTQATAQGVAKRRNWFEQPTGRQG
jgi:hypothetical protein